MIDYRKAGKECREAYFEYREAPIVGASEASVTSFVAGWNAAIASMGQKPHEEPAKKPPKNWRFLEPGEVVCSIDWANAKTNPPSDPPSGLGWIPVFASVGASVCEDDLCIFARPVTDEPAKEPEPQYREPVLPADYNMVCEFSDNGNSWSSARLGGWKRGNWISIGGVCWRYCRIKAN